MTDEYQIVAFLSNELEHPVDRVTLDCMAGGMYSVTIRGKVAQYQLVHTAGDPGGISDLPGIMFIGPGNMNKLECHAAGRLR
jgi:hypothetical protein